MTAPRPRRRRCRTRRSPTGRQSAIPQRFEGDEDSLESSVAGRRSLKDHLEEQLAIAALSPEKRLICLSLIDAVDEAGYLRADLDEVTHCVSAPRAKASTRCLRVLQGFDPVGVAARDLAECLALQLKAQDRLDPAMAALLTRLDLVARRETAALCAICGVDAEDIADMIAEIRALTPKPGLAFGTEPVQPVVPDVFVQRRAGRRSGMSNSIPTRCRACWSIRAITPRSPPARATRIPRTI